MFPLYPYFASFHTGEVGFSGHLGVNARAVFWSISVPAYDRYGFAGYQQMAFGEEYILNPGSSFISYSTGRLAISLFYNNDALGDVRVDTLLYRYKNFGYGGGLAFSPNGWFSAGVSAVLTPEDRGGGVDFTLRYGYLAYVSGGIFYTIGGGDLVGDVAVFLAVPDPRMSSVNLYLSNRYKPSLLVRYETNITRHRRIKLGGGFFYDSLYTPVVSLGERERLGGYDFGFDVTFFPFSDDRGDFKVEWSEVRLDVWVGF